MRPQAVLTRPASRSLLAVWRFISHWRVNVPCACVGGRGDVVYPWRSGLRLHWKRKSVGIESSEEMEMCDVLVWG